MIMAMFYQILFHINLAGCALGEGSVPSWEDQSAVGVQCNAINCSGRVEIFYVLGKVEMSKPASHSKL